MAGGNSAAIKAAVHTLVYSHTHIVRLRVSRGTTLLADDGGPFILAPVSGRLRSHGKEVGHFVFSVQDDLGYVKLETRFVGAPLVLRTDAGNVPIEGFVKPSATRLPDRGPVAYRGTEYEAYSLEADAYPSGRLLAYLCCCPAGQPGGKDVRPDRSHQVRPRGPAHLAALHPTSPAAYPPYIKLVHTMTHALVYITTGSRTLASSSHDTPAKLPDSGAVHSRRRLRSDLVHGAGVGWPSVAYMLSALGTPLILGALVRTDAVRVNRIW